MTNPNLGRIRCHVCQKPYVHWFDDEGLMIQLLHEDYWQPAMNTQKPLGKVLCDHCWTNLQMMEERSRQ